MFDEETIRTERLLRIEAAVEHLVFHLEREARHRVFQAYLVALFRADRADRAGEKRLIGLMRMLLIGWLFGHRGKIAYFLETCRRQLATRIAVNAGRIDKKVACDIGIEPFFSISHCETFTDTNRTQKHSVCAQLSL